MSEEFNEIIDFTICEFIFDFKHDTNYITLNSLLYNLKYSFASNTRLSNELMVVVKKVVKKLIYLYGLTQEESLNYIFIFLNDEKWKKHVKILLMMKKNLNICYI